MSESDLILREYNGWPVGLRHGDSEPIYLAEVKFADETVSYEGVALQVAAWLAGWCSYGFGETGRPVSVWLKGPDSASDGLVDERRTGYRGTERLYNGLLYEPDPEWEEALAEVALW